MSSEPTGEKTKTAMEALGHLSEQEFSRLLSALDLTVKFSTRAELRSAFRDALPTLSERESDNIQDFVFAYAEVIFDRGISDPVSFIGNLAETLAAETALSEAQLAERILALVNAPALDLVVRSSVANRRRPNAVIRTSIQTDVRPIFSDAYGPTPAVFVVGHSIRVVMSNDLYGEEEEVVDLTLDHDELEKLVVQANAALAGEREVQRQMTSLIAPMWRPYENDGESGVD